MFKVISSSVALLCKTLFRKFQWKLLIMTTDLGFYVTSQVKRAPIATHCRFTVPGNFQNVYTNLHCCCIVDRGVPRCTHYLVIEIFGDVATDSSIQSHCFPPIDSLPAIVLSIMLHVTKSFYCNRRVVWSREVP